MQNIWTNFKIFINIIILLKLFDAWEFIVIATQQRMKRSRKTNNIYLKMWLNIALSTWTFMNTLYHQTVNNEEMTNLLQSSYIQPALNFLSFYLFIKYKIWYHLERSKIYTIPYLHINMRLCNKEKQFKNLFLFYPLFFNNPQQPPCISMIQSSCQ